MGTGSHRPAPFNGPSKTGNPSGKGRGNNSHSGGDLDCGDRVPPEPWDGTSVPPPFAPADPLPAGLRVRLDSRVTKVFRAAAEIREARSSSPHDELQVVEARVDAELSAHERKSVAAILKA